MDLSSLPVEQSRKDVPAQKASMAVPPSALAIIYDFQISAIIRFFGGDE